MLLLIFCSPVLWHINTHTHTVLRKGRSNGKKRKKREGGTHLILLSQLVTPWCLSIKDKRHSRPSQRVRCSLSLPSYYLNDGNYAHDSTTCMVNICSSNSDDVHVFLSPSLPGDWAAVAATQSWQSECSLTSGSSWLPSFWNRGGHKNFLQGQSLCENRFITHEDEMVM